MNKALLPNHIQLVFEQTNPNIPHGLNPDIVKHLQNI